MSLRTFHLVFILSAIVCADMFGAWTAWDYPRSQDVWLLSLGIASIVGGFGLIWYAIQAVDGWDKANIH
ncbi:MAG: hypothetical protein HOP29_15435 [Phycisphaerales bacterium]|nr:hypothetical protein [Phycisphaerales bacterium]